MNRRDIPAKSKDAAVSRRGFIAGLGGGAFALGAGIPHVLGAENLKSARGDQADDPFRFVFLPDIHLRKDRRSPEGLAACLDAVEKLDPRPSLLVTGGDLIDSGRSLTPDEAGDIADLFSKIWRDHTDVPVKHCLGNHDAVGWDNPAVSKDHPQVGFNLLQEKLGMDRLYYSFDHGGWHFVVLLNITLTEPGEYVSEYSDEQMAFLKQDLARHKNTPTIIVGHFPAVTAIEFFGGNARPQDNVWTISFQRVARNPMALVEAVQGANVKAILSGHIHRLDRIQAKSQTFLCCGSVSGDKWRGHQVDTPEGFGIFDCRPDGSFEYRYHDYGWDVAG